MYIFKLLKVATFDYDQIKEKMLSGIEIFNFLVSDYDYANILKDTSLSFCY